MRERVAIIGSGVSGLGCLRFLSAHHDVTVFDRDARPGGHAHTIDVAEPGTGRALPMDTGFMVFNEVTYPHLCRLFKELGVKPKKTSMSFAVRHDPTGLEWCGSSLDHLFAQRRNLFSPRFWKLLLQINKFNGEWDKYVKAVDEVKATFGKFTDKLDEISTDGTRFNKLSVPVRAIEKLRKKQGIAELTEATSSELEVGEE